MDEKMQNLYVVLHVSSSLPTHPLIFKGNRIDLELQENWQKKPHHNGNFMIHIFDYTG